MKQITLGTTGITVPQNGFGALPIQRISDEAAVAILRRAYDGGIRFFDTARVYTDSEKKLGIAFGDGYIKREEIYIASKTPAKTPEDFWKDLETCLETLKTDYIDIFQFHCAGQVFAPGDGTGMYECMVEAKKQGKIRHIGMTAHKIQVAIDGANSGLFETIQFPFSYIATEKELELVRICKEKNVGFIAMKGLAGGLINNSKAAMAFMTQFDHVVPIWGIQKESELDEWLSYMEETPEMTPELQAFIEKEKTELSGNFCRGCGYCMPCPQGIEINTCARMYLMLRRAPSDMWLTPAMQEKMAVAETCINCRKCTEKCPYGLDTPELLRWNVADYKKVLKGEVKVTAE